MDGIAADRAAGEGGVGSPLLALDGFCGPLERLLTLARTQRIDLARLAVGTVVDQLAAALQRAPPAMPLGQKGDWVVMAARLLQLRSLLLLPAEPPARQSAAAPEQFGGRLVGLQAIQALAAWLDRRPQLGRDVFARGRPERLATPVEAGHEVDVIAFLWACLALFDAPTEGPDRAVVDRPRRREVHAVPEARERIRRLLDRAPDGGPLGWFRPDTAAADTELRRRSAWSSTFAASLELGKQGDAVLTQNGLFMPIQVSRPPGTPRPRRREPALPIPSRHR
jgi:segregation and condensation protein A